MNQSFNRTPPLGIALPGALLAVATTCALSLLQAEPSMRFPPLLVVVGFAGALGGFAADSLWWRRNSSPARRVLFPLLAVVAFAGVVGAAFAVAWVGVP